MAVQEKESTILSGISLVPPSVTVTSDKSNKLKDPCFHRGSIHSYNIRMQYRYPTIQSFSARRLNIPHLKNKLARLR
ncbi:uncharacterized protein N7487_005388 [Penicillium crustosum]|uniref:uncharacterized protein n=1 Tax=Penicillium crustosum TaxID=36656 RepID=UPI0023980B31|nr:uncharacterized protein N7487_005388 [Penicillium crustosum]KAJ5411029.1 hypothetical protein N7487_005388 [Penicillium crustosum]